MRNKKIKSNKERKKETRRHEQHNETGASDATITKQISEEVHVIPIPDVECLSHSNQLDIFALNNTKLD